MKKIILTVTVFLTTIPMHSAEWSLFSTKPEKVQVMQPQAVKAYIAVITLFEDADFKQVILQLRNVARDPEVHGILLVVDNSGGAVSQFSPIHDMIHTIRKTKPVVGLVNGIAQSCGYWAASATDYLIASSASEIGSIGITWTVERHLNPKLNGNFEATVDLELFKVGRYKGLTYSCDEKLSQVDKEYLQQHIEKCYALFINQVAANRNIDPQAATEWADGKLFLAGEALELGLIDEIGTVFEAEDKLVALLREQNPEIMFDDTVKLLLLEQSAGPVQL